MKKTAGYLLVALTILSLATCIVPTTFGEESDVKIVSKSWYFDSLGCLAVVGEVQNVGIQTLETIYLGGIVTLSDGANKGTDGRVWVMYLSPGQKAPFYLSFMLNDIMGQSPTEYGPSDVVDLQIDIIRAEATDKYQYQGLTVTSQSASVDAAGENRGAYWVSGALKNTGSETASKVRILGTFYNSDGTVIAVGGYTSEVLAESLAPAASIDFKLPAYDINQTAVSSDLKITGYTLLIQAESPTPTGTPPQVTPYPSDTFPTNVDNPKPNNTNPPPDDTSPTTNPTDEQTTNLDGKSNTADSSPPIWVYALVAAGAVAFVGAVLAVRRRKSIEEPEPKKPITKPKRKP